MEWFLLGIGLCQVVTARLRRLNRQSAQTVPLVVPGRNGEEDHVEDLVVS